MRGGSGICTSPASLFFINLTFDHFGPPSSLRSQHNFLVSNPYFFEVAWISTNGHPGNSLGSGSGSAHQLNTDEAFFKPVGKRVVDVVAMIDFDTFVTRQQLIVLPYLLC